MNQMQKHDSLMLETESGVDLYKPWCHRPPLAIVVNSAYGQRLG